MSNPQPAIVSLLDPAFQDGAFVAANKNDYDQAGNLIADLDESSCAQKVNARFGNGVSLVLREIADFVQGLAPITGLEIAEYFRLPRYTTAQLTDPLAVLYGAGATVYNITTEALMTSNGTTWAQAGGLGSLGDGAARSVLGRVANSSGARADIAGAGTANAPAILSDDGSTVAFRTLALLSDTILYDVDYRAVGDITLTDGNHSIAGATWVAANAATATVFAISTSSGFVFDAAASSTIYTTTTRSAANIGIPILDLIPSFDPTRTYVIDVYYILLTLGSAANRVLVCLDNNGAGTDRLSGGGPHGDNFTTQIEATTSGSTPRGAHNVIHVRISPDGVAVYASTYDSGFQTPALQGSYQPHASQNFTPAMDPTGSRFVIAFPTGEAGGAMAATLRHLRARRLG